MGTHTRRIFVCLFTLMLFLTPQLVAQEDATAEQDEPLQEQLIERLDRAVEATAQGVEAGAQFTWPILVRQQVIEGTRTLILALVGGALIFTGFKTQNRAYKIEGVTEKERYSHRSWQSRKGETLWAYGLGFFLVGGAVTMIGTVMFVVEGIAQLLNPEYYALMDVLKALGV